MVFFGIVLVLLMAAVGCLGHDPTAHYGERCRWTNDCIGALVCRNYVCSCKDGTRHLGHGQCAPDESASSEERGLSTYVEIRKSVGMSCNHGAHYECMGRYTNCVDRICKCHTSYEWDAHHGDCKLPVRRHVGSSCHHNHECLGQYTHCNSQVCTCSNGFHWHHEHQDCRHPDLTALEPPKPIGSTCHHHHECLGQYTNCQNQVCACEHGFHWHHQQRDCLVLEPTTPVPSKRVGFSCHHNYECLGRYTNCHDHVCKCEHGFIWHDELQDCYIPEPVHHHHHHPKPVGSSCNHNHECQGQYTHCHNQVCTCSQGYHWHHEHEDCRHTEQHVPPHPKPFGSSCHHHHECLGQYTNCHNQVCACAHGFHWHHQHQDCREPEPATPPPPKPVGSSCHHNYECLGQYTHCHDHVCKCEHGYYWCPETRDCKPQTTPAPMSKAIGESCTYSSECKGVFLSCENNVCECDHGYEWDSHLQDCREKRHHHHHHPQPVGSSCTHHHECLGQYTSCQSQVCECEYSYTWDGHLRDCKPRPPAIPPMPQLIVGAVCVHHHECLGQYTSCENRVCECASGYHWHEHIRDCRHPELIRHSHMSKTIGESCTHTHQCRGLYMSCVDHACQCDSGFEWDNYQGDCREIRRHHSHPKPVGSSCAHHHECQGQYTSCQSQACACENGYTWEISVHDCRPLVHPGHHAPPKQIGSSCNHHHECQGQYTQCEHQACRCELGYTWDAIVRDCTPPPPLPSTHHKHIGDSCRFNHECRGQYTNCHENACKCESGFHWHDTIGDCWEHPHNRGHAIAHPAPKPVGASCSLNYECQGQYTNCLRQVCECEYGYIWHHPSKDCRHHSVHFGMLW